MARGDDTLLLFVSCEKENMQWIINDWNYAQLYVYSSQDDERSKFSLNVYLFRALILTLDRYGATIGDLYFHILFAHAGRFALKQNLRELCAKQDEVSWVSNKRNGKNCNGDANFILLELIAREQVEELVRDHFETRPTGSKGKLQKHLGNDQSEGGHSGSFICVTDKRMKEQPDPLRVSCRTLLRH